MNVYKPGEGNPIQIRSNGTTGRTTIRLRGADGEWHVIPGVRALTIDHEPITDGNQELRAHLTIGHGVPELDVETPHVMVKRTSDDEPIVMFCVTGLYETDGCVRRPRRDIAQICDRIEAILREEPAR
jgi:hypothetical protein